MDKIKLIIYVYVCVILTVIAALLFGILLRTPVPFTIENLQTSAVEARQMPLVRVQGGSIDISNTVDVQGAVSIE